MPTTICDVVSIIRTDTLASGSTSNITVPAGSWYLVAVDAVGAGTTTLAVTDSTVTTFFAAADPTTNGTTAVSDAPDTVVAGPITLTAAGGGAGITFVRLTLATSAGRALTAS
jgi:hypothetical protein